MTMDTETCVEIAEPPLDCHPDIQLDKELELILNFLTNIEEICFKSQQRGERDLTKTEKIKIATEIFSKNKLQFLLRFGNYLPLQHLNYFKKFTSGTTENSHDLDLVLKDLIEKAATNKKSVNVKNRRFEALKQMICGDSYFSESEMMKRNPLLYQQLVGQYLTEDEVKERDRYSTQQSSFVKILLEGIDRNDAEIKRKDQEKIEDNVREESDSEDSEDIEMQDDERSRSPICSRSLWGEFENEDKKRKPLKKSSVKISLEEKKIFKQEFTSTMYQSFLDGLDEDFDYSTVDSNSKYDCIDISEYDEEDKYFDSEEPADAPRPEEDQDSSEDELDIYMSALNDNPAVHDLSNEIKRCSTKN
ncbi:hypothetical protein WA026_015577 [Henosepilachna vigintioctopunctata]|uniref:CCD97-like C-terminal domain-containing protein n=1 Tax=Henosepilachna vigintioctopunctata TaxID=420089 RepID=A0AAW1VDG6_9CUCU